MPISDYRFDPYNNVIVPFQINSETHVIPSNAPYVIRLNEVPLKESPSSLTVKFENNTVLTEVSASPAAGQFWPDFNTADKNWNTGTLKFNVADAGKVVKVSYKGTGTLAGTKSNRYPSCWLERGDGSLGDKVCTNGEVFEGVYNFKSFTVPEGITIYINISARILCTESFIVLGNINGDGRGAAGGTAGAYGGVGPGNGTSGICAASGSNGANGTHAGGGRSYSYYYVPLTYTGSAPASVIELALKTLPPIHGSGGGAGGLNEKWSSGVGGKGAAGIICLAKTISIKGSITLRGLPGGSYGGGTGGGGAIICVADTIANAGTIDVTGGYPGWYKLIELGVL